jgi:signal transduction histidine kinase
MKKDRALRERVKELECLYEISRILRQADTAVDELIGLIVEVLPRGFQYPEAAGARIRAGSICRQTAGFVETRFLLSAAFGGTEESAGRVEVSYPPEIASRDPVPFLPEERQLVEKIAGEISLAVARIRTAEENHRLEEQLRHADRLATIGVLAAGIAHELNEPLAMILGFAQLVGKSPDLPCPAQRDVSRIVDATLHAREIVRNLLTFGHLARTEEADCDVNAIVNGALDFLEPRCRSEGIEVRRTLSPQTLSVRADPTELRQVLVNLAVNAIQAMPKGGRLAVGTERSGESCILTVEDTGIGMPREVLDRIFIPFFTTKEAGRGTGLGLPVIHGIVVSRGGSISVKSEVGVGSLFTVRFPLLPAPTRGEASP